jgi:hypothetical protein
MQLLAEGRPQLAAGIRAGSYAYQCSNLVFPASMQWVAFIPSYTPFICPRATQKVAWAARTAADRHLY